MSVDLTDETPVAVDDGPARLSSVLATGVVALGVVGTAPLSVFSLPLGATGFLLFVVALFGGGSRRLLWLGTVAVFAGAITAGAIGSAPPSLVLTGVAATLLAWDVGQNAISVGEQLGRGASTWRAEVVHAASSTVAAVLIVGAAIAVFQVGTGGQPIFAVLVLLAAGLLLTWGLRS